jgi:hypothetical protein
MAVVESIAATKTGKKVRLGVHWRGQWINFCSLGFLADGSLVFSSKFHNSSAQISLGSAKLTDAGFTSLKEEVTHPVGKGFHVTLHPQAQAMHLRKHSPGNILFTRKLEWFPVSTPFNLLRLYSPPLPNSVGDTKSPHFFAPFPDEYENSIEVVIDVFPRDMKEHYPSVAREYMYWGYCPHYFVRVSFNKLAQKTPALIFIQAGSELKL